MASPCQMSHHYFSTQTRYEESKSAYGRTGRAIATIFDGHGTKSRQHPIFDKMTDSHPLLVYVRHSSEVWVKLRGLLESICNRSILAHPVTTEEDNVWEQLSLAKESVVNIIPSNFIGNIISTSPKRWIRWRITDYFAPEALDVLNPCLSWIMPEIDEDATNEAIVKLGTITNIKERNCPFCKFATQILVPEFDANGSMSSVLIFTCTLHEQFGSSADGSQAASIGQVKSVSRQTLTKNIWIMVSRDSTNMFIPLGPISCSIAQAEHSHKFSHLNEAQDVLEQIPYRRNVGRFKQVLDGYGASEARDTKNLTPAPAEINIKSPEDLKTKSIREKSALAKVSGRISRRGKTIVAKVASALHYNSEASSTRKNPLKTLLIDAQDAMQVTKHLGKRFLWVDTLCIVQDDESHRIKQLRHMDAIYKSAYITIVAWTVTSAISSSAGTQSLGFANCKTFSALEAMIEDGNNGGNDDEIPRLQTDVKSQAQKLRSYMRLVEQYTSLSLTYRSDRLNTLYGLFAQMKPHTDPMNYGLPLSLTWNPKPDSTPATHNVPFPSRSRAGWEGEISFSRCFANEIKARLGRIEASAKMKSRRHLFSSSEATHPSSGGASLPEIDNKNCKILHFTTETVNGSDILLVPGETEEYHSIVARSAVGDKAPEVGSQGRVSSGYISIEKYKNEGSQYEFIRIANGDDDGQDFSVNTMLIAWKKDVAERVCTCNFSKAAWEKADRSLKEIHLQ
ncbi:hypothetical protein PT974_10598 [Cladobotryum mycophilum]|uniref:Heterokaryon incompatibility domain-containing protein n=1 Tax=Cladobotryum mycophilum TaxID=491253 RepID=A0ABR0SBB3_9HYPO